MNNYSRLGVVIGETWIMLRVECGAGGLGVGQLPFCV